MTHPLNTPYDTRYYTYNNTLSHTPLPLLTHTLGPPPSPPPPPDTSQHHHLSHGSSPTYTQSPPLGNIDPNKVIPTNVSPTNKRQTTYPFIDTGY